MILSVLRRTHKILSKSISEHKFASLSFMFSFPLTLPTLVNILKNTVQRSKIFDWMNFWFHRRRTLQMLILMSCICRVLGKQGEPRMSAMCASVAFRTSFFKKKIISAWDFEQFFLRQNKYFFRNVKKPMIGFSKKNWWNLNFDFELIFN